MSRYDTTPIVPPVPAEPGVDDVEALTEVLQTLAPLSPDARKRVLHSASAFYRVER